MDEANMTAQKRQNEDEKSGVVDIPALVWDWKE